MIPHPEGPHGIIRWTGTRSPAALQAAAALARAAVAGHPEDPALHLLLARALAQSGELEEAESCLRNASSRFPGNAPIEEELANVLRHLGDVEGALAFARSRAADWAPTFIFKLLIRHGRRDEAAPLEAAVAAKNPADADLLTWRVRRTRTEPEATLRLCEEVLAHDPAAAHALYYKAVALAQLRRDEEAAALMAIERFVRIVPLAVPAGFDGADRFGEALREEIVGNRTLHRDPAGHAMRSGLRTRVFPDSGDRAATALTGAIRNSIGEYSKALSGDHPFVGARPSEATLVPWAMIFGEAGHQGPHHHPGCWLTGVYYVSSRTETAVERCPGSILIGRLPDWAGVEPPWPVLEIEPVPGTLLLFPSFVPHETLPPGKGAERISVAFDVRATGA